MNEWEMLVLWGPRAVLRGSVPLMEVGRISAQLKTYVSSWKMHFGLMSSEALEAVRRLPLMFKSGCKVSTHQPPVVLLVGPAGSGERGGWPVKWLSSAWVTMDTLSVSICVSGIPGDTLPPPSQSPSLCQFCFRVCCRTPLLCAACWWNTP